jgi:hypothetical protein
MYRAHIYRSRARDCALLAEAASDLEGRQYYLQLAIVWNDMANRSDEAALSQEATGVALLGSRGPDS